MDGSSRGGEGWPDQGELFSEGPGGPIDLAPEAQRWAPLAQALPPGLRLGTSSWSFPGWQGLVYDRAATEATLSRHGLAAYARHPLFRAVGLDRSYYQPLSARIYAHYAAQVPGDFRFLVKMERRLTLPDGDLFLNAEAARQWVLDPAREGLGEKIGVLLLQFPPLHETQVGGAKAFALRLGQFLATLRSPVPIAVELRTRALLTSDYAQVLAAQRATHGYVVHPSMGTLTEQLEALPPAAGMGTVVRWMLAPGQTYQRARDTWKPFTHLRAPDLETRTALAGLIRASAAAEPPAGMLVIVNNKAEGSSPRSIEALVEGLMGLPVS